MAGAISFRFGAFRMDCGQRVLMHRGRRVPLRGKAFDLLELLVRREGQLVDKAALLAALWPGIDAIARGIVDEAAQRHFERMALREVLAAPRGSSHSKSVGAPPPPRAAPATAGRTPCEN